MGLWAPLEAGGGGDTWTPYHVGPCRGTPGLVLVVWLLGLRLVERRLFDDPGHRRAPCAAPEASG